MTQIRAILCLIQTGDRDAAGTDGRVFLGIGAREFRINSDKDDFERGKTREFILGEVPPGSDITFAADHRPVLNSNLNDPRKGFSLDTEYLFNGPVFIRFEPQLLDSGDRWNLENAEVRVVTDSGVCARFRLRKEEEEEDNLFRGLWLGNEMGKIIRFFRGAKLFNECIPTDRTTA